jgi:hypothetical protein
MTARSYLAAGLLGAYILLFPCLASPADPNVSADLNVVLARASTQITKLLDQFSNMKCTEIVEQEKLRSDGKVELKEQSAYDYLVILTNSGGELSLNESRRAVGQVKAERKNTAMLLSNGFATLFLVFHPYYADSFRFRITDELVSEGQNLVKISFEHIPGTRSPAALALRGREYPLELSGEARIDPRTGIITRIEAGVGDSLHDVGLKSLQSEVEFAPASLRGVPETYWFPVVATVEVETPRQHWRNTHRFTEYKLFSVSTEEHVAQ